MSAILSFRQHELVRPQPLLSILTSHGGIERRQKNGFVFRQDGHVLRQVIQSGSVVSAQILNVVPLKNLVVLADLNGRESAMN